MCFDDIMSSARESARRPQTDGHPRRIISLARVDFPTPLGAATAITPNGVSQHSRAEPRGRRRCCVRENAVHQHPLPVQVGDVSGSASESTPVGSRRKLARSP